MGQIEAIIFDWGGVLIDDPRPALLQYCAEAFGISVEDYAEIHDIFLDGFQKGLLSEDAFWENICRELGTRLLLLASGIWEENMMSLNGDLTIGLVLKGRELTGPMVMEQAVLYLKQAMTDSTLMEIESHNTDILQMS